MVAGFIAAGLFASPATAHEKAHKVVLHVDDADPKRMNLVLNNAANVTKFFQAKGEDVTIEIVTYGPGLNMLRADKSPVKKRIKVFGDNYDNISFRACGNTLAKMTKKEGMNIPLLPQAKMVKSGVVHLIVRQEEGWSYVRP